MQEERGDGEAVTYTHQLRVDSAKNRVTYVLRMMEMAVRQVPFKGEGAIFAYAWMVSIINLLTTR
jgi:hypothetical protein